MSQLRLSGIFECECGQNGRGRLEPRSPDVGLGEEPRTDGIVLREPCQIVLIGRRIEVAYAGNLRVETPGA